MFDVTGPISTLPGSIHKLPQSSIPVVCDRCEKLATVRVQGETDSFGAEMHDLCEQHVKEMRGEATIGYCDFCHKQHELFPHRYWDEPRGRVFWLCLPCRKEARAIDFDEI